MNSLSWMIYFAELSGSASGFLSVISFLSGFSAGGCLIGWLVTNGRPDIYSWDNADEKIAAHAHMHRSFGGAIPKLIAATLCFGLVATVLPSKTTVYAIAASEMGEKVITSQTGGKALKALDAWLDRQIAGDAKGGSQ